MRIALACWDYDRTRGIADGRIRPEGLDVTYLPLSPEETFFRMTRHCEFDVAELSLSTYVLSLRDPDPPFVAIPAFPSRAFRHSGIYVREDGDVHEPADLIGKRVGIAEYQLTANVWIRGFLAEHHGVPLDSVAYVTAGLEDPRRHEKKTIDLPPTIHVEPAPHGETLTSMLASGAIDAIYSPRAPSTHGSGARRLFADYPDVERSYYERTQIFPIMHVVAIRADVYQRNRWIAQSLFKAFRAARDLAYDDLHEVTALKTMHPWGSSQADAAEQLMGKDFWSYGMEPNRHVLDKFLEYSKSQGLGAAEQTVDGLFAPETHESFAL